MNWTASATDILLHAVEAETDNVEQYGEDVATNHKPCDADVVLHEYIKLQDSLQTGIIQPSAESMTNEYLIQKYYIPQDTDTGQTSQLYGSKQGSVTKQCSSAIFSMQKKLITIG